MKINTYESVVWWIALADELRPTKGIPAAALVENVRNLFKFSGGPVEQKGGGIEFQNGHYTQGQNVIAITKLTAYGDGLNIQVSSTTDDGNVVLEALLSSLYSLGIREPSTPPNHSYISHVVVDFDCPIDCLVAPPAIRAMADAIYEQGVSVTSLGFGPDPLQMPRGAFLPNAPGFRIERRDGAPFGLNRYFTASNTTTAKHVAALEKIERLAMTVSNSPTRKT